MTQRIPSAYRATFLILVASAMAGQCWAAWKSCSANNGQVLDLTVNTPCNKDRYILQKGTNITLNVQFWSSVDSDEVKVRAHGFVMGVPIPLKMPNEDGCKNSGIECPVKNGEKYAYVQNFEVKPSYPKMSANLRWSLGDSNGGTVACVILPVEIVE